MAAPAERSLRLTPRDHAILDALTQRVKVLSVEQVRRTWWTGHAVATAAARLRYLTAGGWVEEVRLVASAADFEVDEALAVHQPHEREPDWRNLLPITRSRWRTTLRAVRGFVATPLAARTFGGFARSPRPSEATHDLFLASVYLARVSRDPDAGDRWSGEGKLATEIRAGCGVVADALVTRDGGGASTAVEVVGASYSEEKLRAFHEACERRGWSYELW